MIVPVVRTQWRSDAPSEALAEMRAIIARFEAEIPGVVSVVEGASDGYLDHPTHAAARIGWWAERLVVFDLSA